MTLALPPADRELSPYTGWTRAHWVTVADVILDGAARHASPAGSLIRYPGATGGLGAEVDALEGFSRTFMLAGFRIAGDPAGTTALAERYARGIAAGVDRAHPERWLRPDEADQAKVEAAALAVGLHLTRDTVWARLSDTTRAQTIDYLAAFIGAPYPPNNWAWFRIMVEQFLESVGGPFSAADRATDFALLDSFDREDGWIADGDGRNFDHYSGWALPFYPMLWADMVGDDPRHAPRIRRYRQRLEVHDDAAASTRLVSRVVPLAGCDDSATTGVLVEDDVTPLAGRTATPWMQTTVAAGEWLAVGIRFGGRSGEADAVPPVDLVGTPGVALITWQDGSTTAVDLHGAVADAGLTA